MYDRVHAQRREGHTLLTDLDQKVVAGLAVNGRATWTELGHALGVSETTAARRAQRLFQEGVVRIVGVPDPLACGFGQPVLVHLHCAPGKVRHVAAVLADHADARFVAILAGPADVIVELIVSDKQHLNRVLFDELQSINGVTETSTEVVLRTFKMRYDWTRDLLGAAAGELAPADVEKPAGPAQLDDADLALIAELGLDGRRSYADLAAALDMGESLVARRLSRLVSTGCLSFSAIVNPVVLGYSVETFIRLRVETPYLEDAAAELCTHPPARYVSATTGAFDLVCETVLPDTDALYRFVTDTLARLPGLRGVETAMELQTMKRAFRPRPSATAAERRQRTGKHGAPRRSG